MPINLLICHPEIEINTLLKRLSSLEGCISLAKIPHFECLEIVSDLDTRSSTFIPLFGLFQFGQHIEGVQMSSVILKAPGPHDAFDSL